MTSPDRPDPSRRPPRVDALALEAAPTGLPHPLRVRVAREALNALDPSSVIERAHRMKDGMLQPVINATGVLLHTNLGRAPFLHESHSGYTNLELDLISGKRGSRQGRVEGLLAELCGSEATAVVNNGAAAVLLAAASVAAGHSIAVSRGELVEIGGAFRIPEVIAQSGARLTEVGTTNRTRRSDYEQVAGEVAAILKVHQSNFRVVGFTEEVPASQLGDLGLPLVVDLGSGLLDRRCPWLEGGPPKWLRNEPAVRQTLAEGASLVTFSGDKLMGGPQAGIIAGKRELVERCLSHPLYRALRPGQLVVGAIQQIAVSYLDRDMSKVPLWRMAATTVGELRRRAAALGVGEPCDLVGLAGGGTLPGIEIPSAGVKVRGDWVAALRSHRPLPVVARIDGGMTLLDLRTVDPAHDSILASALRQMAAG